MPAAETYFIAWKGRRDGPFSLDQLADLLQKGEIGLLHRVETTGGSMPLRQLLLTADPARWGSLAAAPGSHRVEAPARHPPEPFAPAKAASAAPPPAGGVPSGFFGHYTAPAAGAASPPTAGASGNPPTASSPSATASDPANPFGFIPAHPSVAAASPPLPPPGSHLGTNQNSPYLHPSPPLQASSDASPDALRAYIVCGLTFLFPPLAWYALKLARRLAAHPCAQPNVAYLRHLTYALATTGLLFWILIWLVW